MGFRELINKILGRDPIYSKIKRGEENNYQTYFLKILNSVDIDNLTERAHDRKFDKNLAEKDFRIIDEVANQAKNKDNLLPVIIQIMVEQYVWADPWLRDQDKNQWIYKVLKRKETDYFPDSLRVYHVLFKD